MLSGERRPNNGELCDPATSISPSKFNPPKPSGSRRVVEKPHYNVEHVLNDNDKIYYWAAKTKACIVYPPGIRLPDFQLLSGFIEPNRRIY